MELSLMIPVAQQILEHPGSFFEKLVLGIIFLGGVHIVGKNHVKGLNSRLDNIAGELHRITERLDEGAELHRQHETRLAVLETKMDSMTAQTKAGL